MQTFKFFETTLHLEDFSKCWIGSIDTLPKNNQFTYIPNTMIHIKENFSIEVPKTIIGNIDYRLINYCHLKVNNLDFYYFVKQLKTEITQNNIMFYLEKDEYFTNNLNLGVEYKQTKGIIIGGYRGNVFLNYLNNTDNEMCSDFIKLNGFNINTSQICRGVRNMWDNAYMYLIYRRLDPAGYESPYIHVVKNLIDHTVDAFSLISYSNATNITDDSDESTINVECVRAYIIPQIFFNNDIINPESSIQIPYNSKDDKTQFKKVYVGTSKKQNYLIDLKTLHAKCGRGGVNYNDIANGENIYLCTQNRKWKLPPYTACHDENASSDYTVDFVVNTNDIDIIVSGDFNNWSVESIAKDFEESIIVNSGIIQMLENENLRKTNKIYQGIGIGMAAVSGVANGIANPSSIVGGINGIINSTKGLVTDKAREEDLKNKYNVVGNSGGIANIEHCKYFTSLSADSMRGWYFAYKPYASHRHNTTYLLYRQLQFGYSMPEHITQSERKPSERYMNIVNSVLETDSFLAVFYPRVTLEVAKTLYMRYQVGYDCHFMYGRTPSQKFERALSNGITFYGKK